MSYPKKGDRPAPIAEQNRVLRRVWSALDCFAHGTERDPTMAMAGWCDLCDAINVVEALCDLGKFDGRKVMPHIVKAQEGMVLARRSGQIPMRMHGDHLQALREVVTQYDNALFKLSQNTLAQAHAHALMQILRSGVGADSKVEVVA